MNTKKDMPLVSIITPSYNSEKYISETINSVINQTYQNWEMIIIDDSSIDNSLNIIEIFSKTNLKIKLLYNLERQGVAQSRNKGIEAANGEYIAFLDSDDIWLSEKLEKQVQLMQSKNILMSYCGYKIMDDAGNDVGNFQIKDKLTYKDMLKTSSMGTLTTIYNAQILGKFHFMDIGHEDYVFKLQILKKISFAEGINEPLAKYRISDKSLSSNKFKVARWQWKIYRDIEQLSWIQSMYYFVQYAYHGIFKYK